MKNGLVPGGIMLVSVAMFVAACGGDGGGTGAAGHGGGNAGRGGGSAGHAAGGAAAGSTGTAGGAAAGATGTAGGAAAGSTGTAGGAVAGSTGTAGGAAAGSTGTAGGAVAGSTGTAGGAAAGSTGTAGGAVAGSTGTAGGAGGSAGSGPIVCHSLTVSGDFITQTVGTGTAPVPAGGTIVDGTYVLTRIDVYPPASTNTAGVKATLKFTGTGLQVASAGTGAAGFTTQSYTTAAAGTVLTLTTTCPVAGSVVPLGYTVASGALVLFAGTQVQTYTKQ